MTTPELEGALTTLAQPEPPPELAANVMARIARLEDESPQPAEPERVPTLAWVPVVPGALLVVGAYVYSLAQARDIGGLGSPLPTAGGLQWMLPFDPVVAVLAAGLLLCLGPLLSGASERPSP